MPAGKGIPPGMAGPTSPQSRGTVEVAALLGERRLLTRPDLAGTVGETAETAGRETANGVAREAAGLWPGCSRHPLCPTATTATSPAAAAAVLARWCPVGVVTATATATAASPEPRMPCRYP